jgi:hypothetical protein
LADYGLLYQTFIRVGRARRILALPDERVTLRWGGSFMHDFDRNDLGQLSSTGTIADFD